MPSLDHRAGDDRLVPRKKLVRLPDPADHAHKHVLAGLTIDGPCHHDGLLSGETTSGTAWSSAGFAPSAIVLVLIVPTAARLATT